MTQNEIPTASPFVLTAPVTAAQVASAPLRTTVILSEEGKVIVPLDRLNWALHNSHEGDTEGFAAWVNAEAERIG